MFPILCILTLGTVLGGIGWNPQITFCMLKKGIQSVSEPHLIAKMDKTETWMAFFTDTEGNTHPLMSEEEV
ncbi:hypothetical protein [Fictibacillus sp. NRS-1165]|uniref:hypothetical protein n=1 Tax=Fictibacillus sp. NRS-1165 TaxID=3144463 RepID=UPI003D1AD6A4